MKKLTLLIILLVVSMVTTAQNLLPNDGNVGINTTIPNHELEVNGTTKTDRLIVGDPATVPSFVNAWLEGGFASQLLLNASSSPVDKRLWSLASINGSFKIFSYADDFTSSSEALVINKGVGVDIDNISFPNGSVGVGMIDDIDDTKFYVKSDDLKVGIVSQVNHSIDYQFGILSAVNRANTKALSVLYDQGNGNGYEDTFTVLGNGKVLTTEVEVRVPIFPDYVFNETYELLPLNKLETYINENNHLPNIPPAKDIEENGMPVGDMLVKQMEKIEELTLYILQLNKKIEALENANKLSNEEN